jgi:hypothetical protein
MAITEAKWATSRNLRNTFYLSRIHLIMCGTQAQNKAEAVS